MSRNYRIVKHDELEPVAYALHKCFDNSDGNTYVETMIGGYHETEYGVICELERMLNDANLSEYDVVTFSKCIDIKV